MSSGTLLEVSVAAADAPLNEPIAPAHWLDSFDLGLWVVGAAVIVVGSLLWLIRHRTDPLGNTPPRSNRLLPEYILLLAVGFVLLVWSLQALFAELTPEAKLTITAGNIAQLSGGVACLVLAARCFPGGVRGFLLGRGQVLRCVGQGLVLFLVAMAACDSIYRVTDAVIKWFDPQFQGPDHGVIQALREQTEPAWMLWLGAVLIAPIAEECFFRGFVQTALRNLTGRPWVAVLITAGVFGLAHAQQPQAVLTIGLLGVLLGVAYERSGSLVGPIVLHVLFNSKTMIWYALGAV